MRFGHHLRANRGQAGARRIQRREFARHALERPEQIHRRWPRLRQRLTNHRQLGAQLVHALRRRVQHAQRIPHRRGHADGRRAANHHLANGLGHLAIIRIRVANLFRGKPPLVQHHHPRVGPLNRLCNVHAVPIRSFVVSVFILPRKPRAEESLSDLSACAESLWSPEWKTPQSASCTRDASESWPAPCPCSPAQR